MNYFYQFVQEQDHELISIDLVHNFMHTAHYNNILSTWFPFTALHAHVAYMYRYYTTLLSTER